MSPGELAPQPAAERRGEIEAAPPVVPKAAAEVLLRRASSEKQL